MTTKELITWTTLKSYNDKWVTGAVLTSVMKSNTLGQIDISNIELRAVIQNLRAMGVPIVASEKGYMLTSSCARVRLYCETRRQEIYKELRILNSMENRRNEYLNNMGK